MKFPSYTRLYTCLEAASYTHRCKTFPVLPVPPKPGSEVARETA